MPDSDGLRGAPPEGVLRVVQARTGEPVRTRHRARPEHALVRLRGLHVEELPDGCPEGLDVRHRPAPQLVVATCLDAVRLGEPVDIPRDRGALDARFVGRPENRRRLAHGSKPMHACRKKGEAEATPWGLRSEAVAPPKGGGSERQDSAQAESCVRTRNASALSERDAAAREVVRRELDGHPVARVDADAIAAHLARHVSEGLVVVVQRDAIHAAAKRLDDLALHLDLALVVCHAPPGGLRRARPRERARPVLAHQPARTTFVACGPF